MGLIRDFDVPITDGITKMIDGDHLLICPICREDITYAIDDFEAAHECPNCLNGVRFPIPENGEES
jgi:uncharacterized CHY-type Zn-finger protein